jgi:hypothetical protein
MEQIVSRNKRRFRRHKIDAQVAVISLGRMRFDSAIELSEGGLMIKSLRRYKIGDRLEICFFLADGDFINTTGEVAYSLEPEPGDHHAGVRFVALAPQAAARIRAYVQSIRR